MQKKSTNDNANIVKLFEKRIFTSKQKKKFSRKIFD